MISAEAPPTTMLADIGSGLSVVACTGDEGAAFAVAARDMSEEVLTETAVALGEGHRWRDVGSV